MRDLVPLVFLWFVKVRLEIAAYKSNYIGGPCQLYFSIFLASRGKLLAAVTAEHTVDSNMNRFGIHSFCIILMLHRTQHPN